MSSKIDGNSNIPPQFNKFACNDYVTPPSHAEDDYNLAHIVSPNIRKYLSIYNIQHKTLSSTLCVANVKTGVENYMFDENDEIQGMDKQEQEISSLYDTDPSHYLRHQQSAGIIYANKASNEETKL